MIFSCQEGFFSKPIAKVLRLLPIAMSFLAAFPLKAEGFDIMELPSGKSVTLPHPATTIVPLPRVIVLTSTDKRQILKMTAFRKDGAGGDSLSVTIYDPHIGKPSKVNVKPGQPVVYPFRDLGPIRLKIQPLKNNSQAEALNTLLKVESNRPLGISH